MSSTKTHSTPHKSHCVLIGRQAVYILIFFFPATLRHGTNIEFFSKPQVAAGPPLAVHCQVQEMGLFYQDGANLA